jgi:hypothetical protein
MALSYAVRDRLMVRYLATTEALRAEAAEIGGLSLR